MKFRKWCLSVLFAVVLTAVGATTQTSSQSPEGTWQVVLKFPDDSQAQELLSLTRDGRALTTLFPVEGTPGSSRWGEWRRSGGAIDYTSYTILSNDPAAGFLRARCRLAISPGGNSMSGNCLAELVDSDGNITVSLTSLEINAKRLVLVPLD